MTARLLALCLAALAAMPAPARAAEAAFDLVGPRFRIEVTHAGQTLPIDAVPNLTAGDKVVVRPDFGDERTKFLLVSAFLQGATSPPPKKWFRSVETWKKRSELALTVPTGAHHLALFVVPDTGGGEDAIVDAVRKQPGAFVRASQELYQASLDRARLDRFIDLLREQERADPTKIEALSPVLTRSLAIKLKAECLTLSAPLQAACLTDSRESLLFADNHTSILADTVNGAPSDLAFQLSATPEAGFGFYSPYLAVVRDFARLFGIFQSTQFGYIPALSKMTGDRVTLLLNAPPSFANPKSVMVVAMPAIDAAEPPPLRAGKIDAPICLALPDPVLPIEGAPLIYATRYAHDMVLRVGGGGQTADVPLRADPERGGYVPANRNADLAGLGTGIADARLRGAWGFVPFEGPRYKVALPAEPGAPSCVPAPTTAELVPTAPVPAPVATPPR